MSASGLLEALRPFLWLALAAFITGFLSYVAVSGAPAQARPQLVSAPASDDWNLPKRI
jgi:hypothetical protein